MGNSTAKEAEYGTVEAAEIVAVEGVGIGRLVGAPVPQVGTSIPQVGAAAGWSSAGAVARQPPPDAVMRELPPPVPHLFVPQVPVAPLHQRTEFSPVFNDALMNAADEPANNIPQEKGIPILITWGQGGNEVLVEGSWDYWTSRKALERSGKDHAILLVLPSGVYHYRIIVDGESRYVPELPHVTDERGQTANIVDVHDYVPENLDTVADFDAPSSPEDSYHLHFPADEEFAKEPPTLPPQLLVSVLGGADNSDEHGPKLRPQHVVLNHLFIEKGWGSQSLLALGVTHRFQSKYVNFVLYKPLQRR